MRDMDLTEEVVDIPGTVRIAGKIIERGVSYEQFMETEYGERHVEWVNGVVIEMPGIEETAACIGFWPSILKIGEDLLVYASRFGGSEYLTSICGNHKPAKDAQKDFRGLGPGKHPLKLVQISK